MDKPLAGLERRSHSTKRGKGHHNRHKHIAEASNSHGQPSKPVLSPQQPEAEESDADDFAMFKREAAQLSKRANPQQPLPAGLDQDTLLSAIKQLHNEAGLSNADAEEALLATAEEHFRKGFESWLEESMFWLATRAEANLESHKLAQAMEASLQEQQAARQQEAKQPPLTNLSEERLRKRFASSAVLQCLGTLLPGSVLFCGTSPLREQIKYKLVEVLRLEADCLKWYPDSGARHYFEHFGKTCLEELSSTSSSTTQIIVQAASSMQEAQQQLQQPVQQKPQQRSHQQQQPHALQDVQQQQCHWQCHQQQSPTPPQQQHQQQHKARPAARPPSEESSDAGEGVLKRSTRKRQPPSRYCSPSPCIGGRGRSKQRKVTPEPAGVRSAATASTAKAALSAATAVASMHNGSAAQQNSPAASPINAGSSKGAAVAFKQQQQQQTNEPASNHRLIQRLSELLEQEHKAITEAVFVTLPSAAGAVPDIFKTLQAEAENEGGDESDVELLKVENTAAAATSDRAADAQAEESEPPAAAAIAGAVSGCTAEQSYDAGRAPADIGDDDLSDCIIVNSD